MKDTDSDLSTQTSALHTPLPSTAALAERLEHFLAPLLAPMGYEVVHIELQSHRNRVLRLYIDRTSGDEGIGIEDCAIVSRALDEPLETLATSDAWLGAGYELEVSSPGIDRPLRREKDFLKFKGREIRLSTYRPLSGEELRNESYFQRNPKQKNFIGELAGFSDGVVQLKVAGSMGSVKAPGKKGAPKKAATVSGPADLIHLPLSLVAKANLEPDFEIIKDSESEKNT